VCGRRRKKKADRCMSYLYTCVARLCIWKCSQPIDKKKDDVGENTGLCASPSSARPAYMPIWTCLRVQDMLFRVSRFATMPVFLTCHTQSQHEPVECSREYAYEMIQTFIEKGVYVFHVSSQLSTRTWRETASMKEPPTLYCQRPITCSQPLLCTMISFDTIKCRA
jgi:hypothetical protein